MTDKSERDFIKSQVEQLIPNADPIKKGLIEEAVYKIHVEHLSPAEAMGFTLQEIEVIYIEAYNKFQGGKYEEAINYLSMLRNMYPKEFRYTFGIGAALHYQKKYEEAAGYYLSSSLLDPTNPIPCFHLYDCLMKLDRPLPASWAIKQAVYLSKDNPVYRILKERALLEEKYVTDLIAASEQVKGEKI